MEHHTIWSGSQLQRACVRRKIAKLLSWPQSASTYPCQIPIKFREENFAAISTFCWEEKINVSIGFLHWQIIKLRRLQGWTINIFHTFSSQNPYGSMENEIISSLTKDQAPTPKIRPNNAPITFPKHRRLQIDPSQPHTTPFMNPSKLRTWAI